MFGRGCILLEGALQGDVLACWGASGLVVVILLEFRGRIWSISPLMSSRGTDLCGALPALSESERRNPPVPKPKNP